MSERRLRLFEVCGKKENPELNMRLTHGGTLSGLTDLKELVAAFDGEDAIARVWSVREARFNTYQSDRWAEGINPGTIYRSRIHPGEPKERGRWTAKEIKLPGYEIEVREAK